MNKINKLRKLLVKIVPSVEDDPFGDHIENIIGHLEEGGFLTDKPVKKQKRISDMTVGEIYLELEKYRNVLIDKHGLQWYDLMFEQYGWLMVHRPDAQEKYVGSNESPVFYYGSKEGLKR